MKPCGECVGKEKAVGNSAYSPKMPSPQPGPCIWAVDAGGRRGAGRTGNRRVRSRGSGRGDRQMGACAEPPSRDPAPAWASRSQSLCSSGSCHIGVLTELTQHPARGSESPGGVVGRARAGATAHRDDDGESHCHRPNSPVHCSPAQDPPCPLVMKLLLPPSWRTQLLWDPAPYQLGT